MFMTTIGVMVIGIITGMEVTGVGITGMDQVGDYRGMVRVGVSAGVGTTGMALDIMVTTAHIMEVITIIGMDIITTTTITMVEEGAQLMLIQETDMDAVRLITI
jgi:hypothetical protein